MTVSTTNTDSRYLVRRHPQSGQRCCVGRIITSSARGVVVVEAIGPGGDPQGTGRLCRMEQEHRGRKRLSRGRIRAHRNLSGDPPFELQTLATRVFEYCKIRPQEAVNLRNERFDYYCYWRGEYCVISLPPMTLAASALDYSRRQIENTRQCGLAGT